MFQQIAEDFSLGRSCMVNRVLVLYKPITLPRGCSVSNSERVRYYPAKSWRRLNWILQERRPGTCRR